MRQFQTIWTPLTAPADDWCRETAAHLLLGAAVSPGLAPGNGKLRGPLDGWSGDQGLRLAASGGARGRSASSPQEGLMLEASFRPRQ